MPTSYRLGDLSFSEKKNVLALYRSGLSLAQIAKRAARSLDAVRRVLIVAGMSLKQGNRSLAFSQRQKRRIIRLYESGLPVKAVIKTMGLSCSTAPISRILAQHGIRCRCSSVRLRFSAEDKQLMVEQYRNGALLKEIAEQFNCSPATIGRSLAPLVSIRSLPNRVNFSESQIRRIKEMLTSRVATKQVAKRMSCSIDVIHRVAKELGIALVPGLRNPKPYRTPQGYVYLYAPDHWSVKNKSVKHRVPEHRIVMERKLGRRLKRRELVHHINGIKHDNRPENLAVLTRQTHKGRVKCPQCGCLHYIP
jgi:transposase-like protein